MISVPTARHRTTAGLAALALTGSVAITGLLARPADNAVIAEPGSGASSAVGSAFPQHGPGPNPNCPDPDNPNCPGPHTYGPHHQGPGTMGPMGPGQMGPGTMGPMGPMGPGMMGPGPSGS